MDCSAARRLIDLELDGELSTADARALEGHVASCDGCRRERALMLAVDRVLADAPLERAPAGLEQSVRTEIIRRVEIRRRIDSVVIPVACGTAAVAVGYGVHRLVNWESARSVLTSLGEGAAALVSPLVDRLAGAPGVESVMASEQGALGVFFALGVAAIAVLGVVSLRLAHQSIHGRHRHAWH